MSGDTLEYIHRKKRTVIRPENGVYTLRPDRGCLWLQRLALWVLEKLKCERMTAEEVFEVHHVHLPTFSARALAQIDGLMEQLYHGPDLRIVMGTHDFAEMLEDRERNHPFEFVSGAEICGPQGPKWLGYKVQVLPTFKGIAVIPEKIQ